VGNPTDIGLRRFSNTLTACSFLNGAASNIFTQPALLGDELPALLGDEPGMKIAASEGATFYGVVKALLA
jgi:hypothetical protein